MGRFARGFGQLAWVRGWGGKGAVQAVHMPLPVLRWMQASTTITFRVYVRTIHRLFLGICYRHR